MNTDATPRHITTIQYIRAALAVRLGLEPEHEGATPEWAAQLRTGLTNPPAISRVDETPTAVIAPIRRTLRRPAIALAAVPYQLVDVPYLGELPIGPMVPAHIHDQLIGARQ